MVLRERIQDLEDTCNLLMSKEQEWNSTCAEIKSLYVNVVAKHLQVPVRILGALSADLYENLDPKDVLNLQNNYVGNPEFYPWKVKCEDDIVQNVLNTEDPLLKQLKATYNDEIVKDVLRATSEIVQVNGSARYCTPVAWNPERSCEMSCAEICRLFVLMLINQEDL